MYTSVMVVAQIVLFWGVGGFREETQLQILVKVKEKGSDKSKRKWKLWRSTSEGFGCGTSMKKGHTGGAYDKYSCSSLVMNEEAFAAVVRTLHKDFMVIKQEWAAIRIQALFRGFLARQAFRALRAVVRLQAIFRG